MSDEKRELKAELGTILAHQWKAAHEKWPMEAELWLAVIEVAIYDLQRYRYARGSLLKRYRSALGWLDDLNPQSTFILACEVLNLDPDLTRQAIHAHLGSIRIAHSESGSRQSIGASVRRKPSRTLVRNERTDPVSEFLAEVKRLRSSESPGNWAAKKYHSGPVARRDPEPTTLL